ncbi:MAG: chorismate synthase, partial [Candidatus Bathyarchaeia archaeon]
MASNSIGKEFVVTSFGESHGKCIGVVVDGCPAGLPLSEEDIQVELDRRIPKQREIVSARLEEDTAEILSGVFGGFTTGAPICALVWNKGAIPEDYEIIKDLPRPGHADYTAYIKYGGFNDYRGGGRFSGRVIVALLMAGAIAKKLLSRFNVEVLAYTIAIGEIKLERQIDINEIRRNRYESAVRCPDPACSEAMQKAILKARGEGDSLGGIVECIALHVPAGIGEPLFESLDSEIAKMLFNIPAVKGVEFGRGFEAAKLRGSENNDAYIIRNGRIATLTNNAGGILGGISSGMPIIVRAAIKPTPSIQREQRTVNLSKMEET